MTEIIFQYSFVLAVFIMRLNIVLSADSYSDSFESEEKLPKFNLHSSDFAEITTTVSFVDKSLFIKTFIEDHGIVVLTAPHHFGKSTNINMLKRFLEIEVDDDGNKRTNTTNAREPIRDTENYNLFVKNKLKIVENETFMNCHFGKNPVISVDFEFDNIHVMNYDIAMDHIKYIIHHSYTEHHYLKKSERLNSEERTLVKNWCSTSGYSKMSESDVDGSLRMLSKLLYKHYETRRIYVLMDNFDSPVINSILFAETENIMGGVYRTMSSIILKVLQKNNYVHRGLISGVSYIAGSPALYGLGYVAVCRFLEDHEYAGFHGLTKEESVELLSRDIFNLTSDMIQRAEINYGGYQSFGNVTLYNMWSVIHMLLTKQVRNYWKGPGLVFKLETLLSVTGLKKEIDLLIKGQERKARMKKIYAPDDVIRLRDLILKPIIHKDLDYTDLVFSFLLELGYLTYVPAKQPLVGKKLVKIPNKQMRKVILDTIKIYDKMYAPQNANHR